jgi:hypothetical protein
MFYLRGMNFNYLLTNEKTTLSLSYAFSGLEPICSYNDFNRILEIYLGAAHKLSEVWSVNFQGGHITRFYYPGAGCASVFPYGSNIHRGELAITSRRG